MLPAAASPWARAKSELNRANTLTARAEPHQSAWGRLGSEHGRGAKGTHHFVVPHVNNPGVRLITRAFPGHGQERVGVDGGHGDTDDFEIPPGKPSFEQGLEAA